MCSELLLVTNVIFSLMIYIIHGVDLPFTINLKIYIIHVYFYEKININLEMK